MPSVKICRRIQLSLKVLIFSLHAVAFAMHPPITFLDKPGKNGIESHNDGGELLIKTTASMDSRTAQILISDKGCGIAPRELRNIFHLFYTTRRSGTGLGLAVAKSIIENHNGWIDVMSKQKNGTTFHINLPYKQTSKPDSVIK